MSKDKSGEFEALGEKDRPEMTDRELETELHALERIQDGVRDIMRRAFLRVRENSEEFRMLADHINFELWLASDTWRAKGSPGNWHPIEGNIAEESDLLYVLKRIFRSVSEICNSDRLANNVFDELFDLVCDLNLLLAGSEIDWSKKKIYRGRLRKSELIDLIPKSGNEENRLEVTFAIATLCKVDGEEIPPASEVLRVASDLVNAYGFRQELPISELKASFERFMRSIKIPEYYLS